MNPLVNIHEKLDAVDIPRMDLTGKRHLKLSERVDFLISRCKYQQNELEFIEDNLGIAVCPNKAGHMLVIDVDVDKVRALLDDFT